MTTAQSKPLPIDPWHLQRALMLASGQHLPDRPEINKGVLLYAALTLEELAETIAALTAALDKVEGGAQMHRVAQMLGQTAKTMQESSKAIRSELETVPAGFAIFPNDEDLVELADGTTDVAVVNAGFALSLGLDGSRCYAEVGVSNLSKANPDTGVIDKTADGKWIKGRDYKAPNLARVVLGK